MPIDFNPEDHTVVYPYFTDTLLDLMRADPDFPPTELKKILRYVGEAIQELHAKDWLHLGMRPATRALGCRTSYHSGSWQM
jgi:serine/threonine protein kinase